jgi:hypothetical protein
MVLGQSTAPANNPASQTQPARRGGGGNCFQQAGIEKSVMEQIHTISHDARSQIEAVCSNSSLTAEQKHQQAHEIREQAMQKREKLLTPDQQKSLAACQQERGGNHPNGGGMHEGMGNGCGEMPGGRPSNRPSGNGSTPPANPPSSN